MKNLKDTFIYKAMKKHGEKYDYSQVYYVNAHTKVKIICPIHGEFYQMPYSHVLGNGCPSCGGVPRITKDEFINEARRIHCNKYDYSKVEYKNNTTHVTIICQIHGEFRQTPKMHKNGQGCPACGAIKNVENRTMKNDEFISRAKLVHGDKYDYSKSVYTKTDKKVEIICPIHGLFFQTPHMHLNGNGCPKCKQSHLERLIQKVLDEKYEYKYNNKPSFLNGLEADFILDDKKVIIECQGKQHLIESHFFEPLDVVVERDIRKNKLANENGYNILYVINDDDKETVKNDKFCGIYNGTTLTYSEIEKDANKLYEKINAC